MSIEYRTPETRILLLTAGVLRRFSQYIETRQLVDNYRTWVRVNLMSSTPEDLVEVQHNPSANTGNAAEMLLPIRATLGTHGSKSMPLNAPDTRHPGPTPLDPESERLVRYLLRVISALYHIHSARITNAGRETTDVI